jgi:PAS domain S-box-containing protein
MREKKDGRVDRWLGVSTDITKLKETEFTLAQREEHFSFLYQASSILSSSLNYNETLARLADVAVPKLADWCSISLVEESGPRTIALSHPDPAMKKVAEDFRLKYPTDWSSDRGAARVLKTGKSELHDWVTDDMIVASAKDPEHLELIRALKIRSVMFVPIAIRGETLGVLTLVSSGDDRKYTETDLHIAEEVGKRAGLAIDNARLFTQIERERAKLSTIFSQAPVGIAVLEGPDHVISMVNSYYSSLFYGGRNDFVGKSVQEAIPEAVEQGFVDILNRVYQTGEPFVGKEVPIDLVQNNGTGKHFYINFVYQPLRNHDQKIYGIVAVVQDVTEQVQSRATLETIFQASPAAMVLWKGSELVFDKINPRYQSIFSDRELLGKPFTEALPETKGQPFEHWIKHVFETGETRVQPEQLAKLVLHQGGPIENRYFDMSFVRVMGVDHKPYGVYEHAVDVTDRVLSRLAVEASKAELEMTVKSLEQEREIRERFVATLTHDLRTPLTAAKMGAQLIQRKTGENETLQKLASKVVDNMDRADEMIRDLLDANLIRAGEKIPIEIRPCNLNEIAEETIGDLGTVYGDRFVLLADQTIHGFWSASGIRRILENLCSNAIKYGESQRPIHISLNSADGVVSIAVKNYGTVIHLQDQAHLFNPFHRTISAKSGNQRGWGLGLTLVKGIAEAHGGRVEVSSSDSQGTTFTVSLPLEPRS